MHIARGSPTVSNLKYIVFFKSEIKKMSTGSYTSKILQNSIFLMNIIMRMIIPVCKKQLT